VERSGPEKKKSGNVLERRARDQKVVKEKGVKERKYTGSGMPRPRKETPSQKRKNYVKRKKG